VQASTGSIVAGTYYVVAYQSQLNTGAGGFVIVSATPASLSVPVTVPNGGTGDTSMTAYAVVCGGTTSTNPLQPIASVGTVGQVLTSNGGGALPTMQNGGVTPLVTLTASSSASLQDTTHITGSYTRYMFVFQNIVLASSSADFTLQWHSGGIFQSTSYLCNSWGAQTGTGGGANLTTAVLLWSHTATVNVATAPGLTGFGCFSAPAAGYGFISGTFVGTNGVVVSTGISGGFWNNTGAIDGFSFQASTGNITSGAVTLYGLG
jgi:hypothetical protein